MSVEKHSPNMSEQELPIMFVPEINPQTQAQAQAQPREFASLCQLDPIVSHDDMC